MATGGETDILSDETFDILCSVCKTKNKNTEAAKFCLDCQDYYCSTCVKFHDDVPALFRHKILDRGQFQPAAGKVQQTVPTERCDRHSHKHVDMYCQNHDDVGCSTCMAVNHKLCQDTFYIPDFLKSDSTDTDTPATHVINEKLETTEEVLIDLHANLIGHLEEIDSRTQSKAEDNKNNKTHQTSQNSCRKEATRATQKVIQSNIKTQSTDGHNFDSKTHQSTQSINEKQVASVTQKVFNSPFKTQSTDEHNIDSKAQQSIQRISERQYVSAKQTVSDVLMNVNNKKKYNVKLPSDTATCYIYSACILDDGTIILADFENNKLKRVDSSAYTVTDYCAVSGDLYQVCKISNKEVAVSGGMDENIQIVSIGRKMIPTKQIETEHCCYGLAYAAGHLYISNNTSVYIYTISGNKLHKYNKDQSGQELFSDIYSLAVSNDGSIIYVADMKSGLIALERDGIVIGEFNGPELKNAKDVCMTNNGSVLVCGFGSKNVLQFTPDCEKIGEVLKCDSRCKALCYDSRHCQLIVGSEWDDIYVYDVI